MEGAVLVQHGLPGCDSPGLPVEGVAAQAEDRSGEMREVPDMRKGV